MPFRACLVTDPTGPNGPAFAGLAYAGLLRAEKRGVEVRDLRSASAADDVAKLRACVRWGSALTVGVGYEMSDAMDAVAGAFPRHAFAIVDVDVRTMKHRPANVTGVLFREQDAGYLVGYAAGLWAKMHRGKAVGSVGSIKIPPVDAYIAGYQFGASKADPGIKLLNDYSQEIVDAAACRKQALDQIGDGSVVEFQVAGRCGLGVLAAAHEKHVLGIGDDTDQGALGPWVMTSALKRVDVAVDDAIVAARSGGLAGGRNVEYGAAAGAIGYGRWSPDVPTAIRAAVARQYRLLRAGRIGGIPATVS